MVYCGLHCFGLRHIGLDHQRGRVDQGLRGGALQWKEVRFADMQGAEQVGGLSVLSDLIE